MPKVSVIIPTYNRPCFLKTAVESVLNQTFQDFDVFIVDDASTDETREIVCSFNDKRIRYFRHRSNKGNGAARNTGIQNSAGDYVALLDDDDEWLPDKLRKQVEILSAGRKNVGCVYTGFFLIDKVTGKTAGQIKPSKRGSIFNDLLSQNWVGTASTLLLRRECFERVGLFDEGLSSGVDYDMWLRIAKEFQFEYIREPLVNYSVHDDKLSTNYEIMIRGLETLYSKYGPLFALNSKGYSDRYLFLGVLYCYTGNLKKGREAFLKAVKIYPFKATHYFNLFLSFLGADNFKKFKEAKGKLLSKIRPQSIK